MRFASFSPSDAIDAGVQFEHNGHHSHSHSRSSGSDYGGHHNHSHDYGGGDDGGGGDY